MRGFKLVVLQVQILLCGVAFAQVAPDGPWVTPLGYTPSDWEFAGAIPLLAIKQHGDSAGNMTEVQEIHPHTHYTSANNRTPTTLQATDSKWAFVPYSVGGDPKNLYTGSGLAAIYRNNPSDPSCNLGNNCSTELHVLDSKTNYTTFKFQTKTALHATDANWSFGIDDGDLVAITRTGGQGTEVHVLDKSTGYKSFKFQTGTALPATDSDWEFGVLERGNIAAIHKHDDQNGGFLTIKVLEKASFYKHVSKTIKTTLAVTGTYWKFTTYANRILAINTNSTGSGKTEVYQFDLDKPSAPSGPLDCVCADSAGYTLSRVSKGCPDVFTCQKTCYDKAQNGLISTANGIQVFCR